MGRLLLNLEDGDLSPELERGFLRAEVKIINQRSVKV